MTIDGTDHSISKLMRKGKLVLTHRQGAFGLSIVALDYINGGNYSYLYNLEGFDSQWNDNRHNNRLLFANLPPGNYSLNVRYRNNMTGELSPGRPAGDPGVAAALCFRLGMGGVWYGRVCVCCVHGALSGAPPP